ncbi:MAG TPA: PaaI family thioesterase [Miltoncostaeaceae bacterium]|nr:PaaI family thioesterase [Miltoncostaeaceae bacterium]
MTDETGLNAHLGIRDRKVVEGRAEVVMEAGDEHLNPAGTVHGGAIATLVDVAMGRAVGSMIDEGERPVTIEMKLNYLEPGRPGALVAVAEVRRRGRLFTVVQAEVVQVEDGETLAEAMGTFTSTG